MSVQVRMPRKTLKRLEKLAEYNKWSRSKTALSFLEKAIGDLAVANNQNGKT